MVKLAELYEKEKKKYLPIQTWRVRSSHRHPDTGEFEEYLVERWEGGSWTCNCLAGFYGKNRKKCKHVLQKMDELAEQKL